MNRTVQDEAPLLPWLYASFAPPLSRTRVKELLSRGAVFVNGTSTTKHDHPLQSGDEVSLNFNAESHPRSAKLNLTIVHEDPAIIVIDKPAGLLSVATDSEKVDTAFTRLLGYLTDRKSGRPFVVHRLDRDTSGLLLFARSAAIRDTIQESWAEVTKTYLGIVRGHPTPPEGRLDTHLIEGDDYRVRVCHPDDKGAKQAISLYKVLQTKRSYSLVEVTLVTGRKHQIRVHMKGLNCPIVGDKIYGPAKDTTPRMGLHATRLKLVHPVSKEVLQIESPLPRELRGLLG
jgi:23S rRNA pseudouridine1911/1915/1917 synthase